MRPRRPIAWVVASAVLSAIAAGGTASDQQPDPPELLEVETIMLDDGPVGKPSFNGGRPYVISINEYLPAAKATRSRLVARLHDSEQLDRFVFEWFGKYPMTRLNLGIGKGFPVEAAQAILATYASDSALLVYLYRMDADDGFGNTHRAYVGGLVDRAKEPLKPERLKALLNPLLTRDEFMKLIPESS
jgi:hypothetical protein